jgi:signal transduction histidine kinase
MPSIDTTDAATERHKEQFLAFKLGDGSDRVDIVVRVSVVALMAVALWYATAQTMFLGWGAIYVVATLLYVAFLQAAPEAIRPIHLRIAIGASIFVTALYGIMTVYIATLDDGAYIIVAACGCVGLALHCLARNAQFNISAFVDFFAALITSSIVLVIAALGAPTMAVSVAILLGAVCAIAYFCLTFRQIITDREMLTRTLRDESQSQKMRAMGQLTSGVAHDFNNLLTVINGNLELARLDPNNAENETFLREAETAGHRGAELVRQLLAYARKSQLTLTNVDLVALFTRVEAVLARTLPVHIRLHLDDAKTTETVRGDATLLESALLNLVINARDAIGSAPGEIRITVQTDADPDFVKIFVTDSGPGMSPDLLQRATEPFFTTKAVGDGSGLGLSMVKGFAEQSGGTMELRNAMNGGLQAILRLPRGAPERDATTP